MELLHTGGIVSTEVEVKQTDALWAWLRTRERRQSNPTGSPTDKLRRVITVLRPLAA